VTIKNTRGCFSGIQPFVEDIKTSLSCLWGQALEEGMRLIILGGNLVQEVS